MTVKSSHSDRDKSEIFELLLRVIAGGLTVGLLIVLPSLQILGVT
jgi:hypothetical protein